MFQSEPNLSKSICKASVLKQTKDDAENLGKALLYYGLYVRSLYPVFSLFHRVFHNAVERALKA